MPRPQMLSRLISDRVVGEQLRQIDTQRLHNDEKWQNDQLKACRLEPTIAMWAYWKDKAMGSLQSGCSTLAWRSYTMDTPQWCPSNRVVASIPYFFYFSNIKDGQIAKLPPGSIVTTRGRPVALVGPPYAFVTAAPRKASFLQYLPPLSSSVWRRAFGFRGMPRDH